MNFTGFAYLAILALFSLMAFRAFRSGSATDYVLCGAQVIGLLVMFGGYRQFGAYLLLITAMAYLTSQIATGARPISRALPIAAGLVIVLSLYAGYI